MQTAKHKYKLDAMKKYYSTDDGLVTSSKVKKIVDKCQKIEEGISKQNRKTSKEVELKIFDLQRNKLFEQRNKLLNASQKEVLNIIIKMIGDYMKDEVVLNFASQYESINPWLK